MVKLLNKESVKHEIELFKVYSIFFVGLVTAISAMLLNNNFDSDPMHQVLFILAIVAFVLVFILLLHSYFVIKRTIKNIKP